MSAKRRGKAAPESKPVLPSFWERGLSTPVIAAAFALGVLLFYAAPLFDSAASIQWDAADVHYSSQKYFSDVVRSGALPHWTPFIFSGMPFLADPQVGAWYPLNWPFFVAGITSRAIEWETALHAFLAALGAFLLARALLNSRWAGVFCGVFYALSGFFAGHSSHTGIFQAAALFPWMLFAALRAAESPRWLPVLATVSGCLVLAGHFQTALYGFCGLGLFLAAHAATHRDSLRNAALALATAAVAAFALSAVMTLPGLELTSQSIRAGSDFTNNANNKLVPEALLTLVSPDYYGAPEVQGYTGPPDVTQFFLYQGILLLPLAAAGMMLARTRGYALALIVPALWYAFGPPGGFYALAAQLPGLRNVRSPIQTWFLVAFGLSLAAAAGVSYLRTRVRSPWLPVALCAIAVCDLWYWNMSHNGLAYARQSFAEQYMAGERRFATLTAAEAGPVDRIWAPFASPSFGPLNSPLDIRVQATYGYNPLTLARYAAYMDAANANPHLLDGLTVTAKLDAAQGVFAPNPTALPRFYAPPAVSAAATPQQAAGRLASLDPAKESVAERTAPIPQNGPVSFSGLGYAGSQYRVHYQAARPSLVRLAVPYFPGWRAEVDGRETEVVPVDFALMGTVVPAGSHDLVFRYQSNWFTTGAAVSATSWLLTILWCAWVWRVRTVSSQP